MVESGIGPYQVLEKLGEGGMGEVYLAHDPRLGRRVAVKSVSGAWAATAEGHVRLLREAHAAAQLNHPNIAAIYDVLEQADRTFIVMEYVQGETLADRIRRGALQVPDAIEIARQLADALGEAHAQHIIHRDLKPANVLITPAGRVKILDFGLAKTAAPVLTPTDATRSVDALITAAGQVVGTPAYMSPEQLLGQPLDARTDVYSLGAILFEMLTGRRPFEDTQVFALATAVLTKPAPGVDTLAAHVPASVGAIVKRALAKDPGERQQSALELMSELAAVLEAVRSGHASGSPEGLRHVRSAGTADAPALVPGFSPAARDDGPALAGQGFSPAGGVVRHERAGLRRTVATALRRRWVATALAIVLVFAAGWLATVRFARARFVRWGGANPAVVAILPVKNVSGDPGTERLGAGLAAVLTSNLGTIPKLRVTRAPAPAADRPRDARTIAAELGADFVIDVSMERLGNRLLATARLSAAGASRPPWTASFEGDVLALERGLLDGLAGGLEQGGALGARLTPAERGRLTRLPTTSGDALVAYSEARALLDRPDVPGNLDRALALLEQACAKDSRFALAYAAIGDAAMARYQQTRQREDAERATAAVLHALELDPNQAAVRYALASMRYQTGQPFDAIAELRRAQELQPDNDDTHRLLGRVLAETGKVEEGIAELGRAIALRPRFWSNHFTAGWVFYNAGRYREALAAYTRVTELQPNFAGGYQMLGTTYHVLGETEQAVGNYEHAVRLGPSASAYSNLGFFYFVAGRFPDSLRAYQEALKRSAASPATHRKHRRRLPASRPA